MTPMVAFVLVGALVWVNSQSFVGRAGEVGLKMETAQIHLQKQQQDKDVT